MIDYDRNSWWRVVFAWHGTVLPHIMGRVGLLTGLSLLVYGLYQFVPTEERPKLGLPELGHSVLGVALSMLIVFRTNSSNNRFWEARSHWGMLVNNTRSLARQAAAFSPPADSMARLIHAYVVMVKEQLRGNRNPDAIRHLLPGRLIERLQGAGSPANVLTGMMSEWIAERLAEGKIDSMMAQRMESMVVIFADQQGGCEKILKTPLPFVYAALIKQILFLYLATLPFVLVPRMAFLAPLVVAGISLGMLGIEEAGVEIESPFGLDPNHLPLDGICEMIGRDANELATRTRSKENMPHS